MRLLKEWWKIQIDGDCQNSFIVGRKSLGVNPTKIEERCMEYEDKIDREYLIFERNKIVASVVNVPVVVFYKQDKAVINQKTGSK